MKALHMLQKLYKYTRLLLFFHLCTSSLLLHECFLCPHPELSTNPWFLGFAKAVDKPIGRQMCMIRNRTSKGNTSTIIIMVLVGFQEKGFLPALPPATAFRAPSRSDYNSIPNLTAYVNEIISIPSSVIIETCWISTTTHPWNRKKTEAHHQQM